MSKRFPGYSILIATGAWSTPSIMFGHTIKLRICLGFIAISFAALDLEAYIESTIDRRNHEQK